jgi:mono/diheme cytochrome c family protein
MIVSKTPKVLFSFVILALAGALAVTGCGGSGGSTSTNTETTSSTTEATEEAPAAEEKAPSSEASGAESALAEEGKMIFTSTCGSCHTLSEAGTSGKIGPNLDELEPDLATVEHQVINGGGPMPAFGKEGTLSSKEVTAVATYVSSVAGTE